MLRAASLEMNSALSQDSYYSITFFFIEPIPTSFPAATLSKYALVSAFSAIVGSIYGSMSTATSYKCSNIAENSSLPAFASQFTSHSSNRRVAFSMEVP